MCIRDSLKIVCTVVLGVFQMRQEPYKFALLVFVQVLIDLGLSYLLVEEYNMGLYGRLEGVYSGFFISMVIGLIVLKRMDLFSFKYVRHYSAKILSFTMPLIPHTLAGAVLAMSDRYFLASMVGEDSVGVYGVAYQGSSIMMLVGMSVCQAWNPFLFRLLKSSTSEANKKIRLAVSLLISFFVMTGVLIYTCLDYFFEWFVDEKYFGAKLIFPWLLIGFVCQTIYLLFSSKFFYYKKTAQLAMLTTIFAAVNLLLNYILIGQHGVLGAAYSTAITWFLTMFCVALFSLKQFKNISTEITL
jgi:O-antigen/teichoic acid export membrane protein